MCVSALILSKGIIFSYALLAGVFMRGCYVRLTLPNPHVNHNQKNRIFKLRSISRKEDLTPFMTTCTPITWNLTEAISISKIVYSEHLANRRSSMTLKYGNMLQLSQFNWCTDRSRVFIQSRDPCSIYTK